MASIIRSMIFVASVAVPVGAALTAMGVSNELVARRVAVVGREPAEPAAARTLLTLDLNKDGLVDPSEVTAFAKTQGYDAAPTMQEFMGFDANHDGSLDMTELSNALSPDAPVSAVASQQAAARQQQEVSPPQVQPVQLATPPAVELPAASSVLLAEGSVQKSDSEEKPPNAQAAASLIAHELSIEASKEKDARFLDRKAAELRANATAITRQTVQRVLDAGSKAASEKTSELLQKLSKIEDQAEQAEVQAAALRAKSRAELEQASDFMSIANAALGTQSRGM